VPPEYEADAARPHALLRGWSGRAKELQAGALGKVIYPLEHAYSPAELGFTTLEGVDATVARVIASVARQAGCELHLAPASITESGTAEHRGYYRRATVLMMLCSRPAR
jgi:hypothetical protein